MPLLEQLPLTEHVAQWPLWGTTARLVVTDSAALEAARALVHTELRRIDDACNRFREDSELSRLTPGELSEVSEDLAGLLAAALLAAQRTDGDVDPTLGDAISALGYDRDLAHFQAAGTPAVRVRVSTRERPDWRQVQLIGRQVLIPRGVRLDLGATAKAVAADRCAALVARRLGVGVLIALGGDVATAGPPPVPSAGDPSGHRGHCAPEGPGAAGVPGGHGEQQRQGVGWTVLVQDGPGEPAETITLPPGGALATSSTRSRRWRCGTRSVHHVLDPRTLLPVDPVWRTVSVAAGSCVEANTASTAALVRGHAAMGWLRAAGTSARFVAADGLVLLSGDWPGGGVR